MARLPIGFQELTYIESTGTQYIDTGIIGKTDEYKVSTKVRTSDDISSLQVVYGSRKDSGNTRFMVGFYTQSSTAQWDLAIGGDSFGSTVKKNTDYELETDFISSPRTLTINSTDKITETQSINTGVNIFLFSYNRAYTTTIDYGFKGRIYYWRLIGSDGSLIRDFIPCIRKIDQVVGMYDKVTDSFFENKGTGSFIAGDVVVGNKPRLLFMGNNGISGYEFYDYIENTGAQRIDTGILPKANQDFEVRFKLSTLGSNGAVFGGRDTQTNKTATLFYLTSSRAFRFDRKSQQTVSGGIVPRAGDVFKFEYSNGVATLTNETTGQTATTTMTGSYDLNGNYPIHLFCTNTAGTKELPLNGSIYEWKCKENGELIQHLVPSKQLASNSIGMLDLANNEFHPNVGSGVFTVGNVIPAPVDPTPKFRLLFTGSSLVPSQYEVKEYLTGDGRAFINTGIQYQQGDIIELNGRLHDIAHDNALITMIPWNSPLNTRFMFSIADSGSTHSFTMAYNSLPGGSNSPQPQYYDTDFHIWRYEGRTLTIDNGLVSLTNTTDYVQGVGTLYLFYKYNGPTATSIKYYNHWRNGQLIASYIPVLRKSDNVLGMYDIVTDTLHTNNGTGGFTAGQTINATNMKSRLLYIPR